MNPGGIRADLAYKAAGNEGDGVVTYGESYTVQPFTNMMNVVDLTGAQLITALQQQVSGPVNGPNPKILQVSKGFTYTLDMTKAGVDRVVVDSVRLNGTAIDPAKTYRVAMNEFLAGGGDGFTVLKEHKNKLVGASDLECFNAYLNKSSAAAPIAPCGGGPDHGRQVVRGVRGVRAVTSTTRGGGPDGPTPLGRSLRRSLRRFRVRRGTSGRPRGSRPGR